MLNYAQSKLMRFANPNTGELVADLATGVETPDRTTVVLPIRQGVKWHDAGPGARHAASTAGRDLTVEDIVFNIERQRAGLLVDGSDGSFGRKAYWNKIASITTTDDTITLQLEAPDGTFVEGLANEFNVIQQPELIEAVEPDATTISADKVIGTGPYILTEWIPGEGISAVRNPNYYNPDRPFKDGQVWLQSFEDPTAYRIGFEQKQIDSMTDPDPDVITAIHESNKDDTYLLFSGVANTVAMYLDTNKEPFSDLRLVRALHLAFNRRQLIQQLHNGLGKVSGPVAWLQGAWAISQEDLEDIPGYRSDKTADLKTANELWAAAGGATVGTIEWVVPDTWASRAGWGATPDIMTQMFNEAFNTSQFKGRTKGYGEIIPSWFAKNFDPFFGWIPNVEIPDARADMISAFDSSSPANIWSVNEPDRIDARLAAAAAELDKGAANEILREVQDFVLENGHFGRVIAYNYISPAVRWNYLHATNPGEGQGWNFLANSLTALDEWIDPDDPTFSGRQSPTPVPV